MAIELWTCRWSPPKSSRRSQTAESELESLGGAKCGGIRAQFRLHLPTTSGEHDEDDDWRPPVVAAAVCGVDEADDVVAVAVVAVSVAAVAVVAVDDNVKRWSVSLWAAEGAIVGCSDANVHFGGSCSLGEPDDLIPLGWRVCGALQDCSSHHSRWNCYCCWYYYYYYCYLGSLQLDSNYLSSNSSLNHFFQSSSSSFWADICNLDAP